MIACPVSLSRVRSSFKINLAQETPPFLSLHLQPFIQLITSIKYLIEITIAPSGQINEHSVDLDRPVDLADESVGSVESNGACQQPEGRNHDHLQKVHQFR